ncbi:MAG: PD-(D/E)XK nuclease family protein, partial [Clostridia bacterium]|nr:PD-(D/E)XK nuclease family protein [Clostridia bacterium]
MTETIILAPGASPSELLRTFARHGKNTLGVRIMNSVELAKTALARNGIPAEETYISKKEEPVEYAGILRDSGPGYFKAASYADAENLAAAINSARMLLPENEYAGMEEKLSAGEFPEKNAALLAIYKKYISNLKESGKPDNIGIIRKAVDSGCSFKADFLTFAEFPLTPLEKKLIDTVSGGRVAQVSLVDYSGKAKAPVHIDSYVRAYGASNEVEWIIGEIFEKKIPVDNCTIAVTDSARYSQLFYDFCTLHGIPVTFGCGLPISNSYPAALLKLLNTWNTAGFNGIDALNNLISSEAFDKNILFEKFGGSGFDIKKVISLAGSLRICFDKSENKKRIADYEKTVSGDEYSRKNLEYVKILASEFEKGPEEFISAYSVIRAGMAGRIDRSALELIRQSLRTYLSYAGGNDISEIVPRILSSSVCSENSREGCLFVTGISSAINTIREHLFVAGMSASDFPGLPKENYLLLDSDYLLFGDAGSVPGSEQVVIEKKNRLNSLVDFASAAGSRIVMTWSGFNLSEIKEMNPSSVLFDYYSREYGGKSVDDFESAALSAGFFCKNTAVDTGVCRAFSEGTETACSFDSPSVFAADYSGSRVFSPSDIEKFLSCPRRFYLSKILGIPEAEEDDPFSVISPRDFGTLVHKAMEYLAGRKMSESEFIAKGREMFYEFLCSRPAVHETDIDYELEQFEDC